MMRIIIEIEGKEFLSTVINTDIANADIPKTITELSKFTSKDTPPQELLNLAKTLGALNAGSAPSWTSQAEFTSPSLTKSLKTKFDDQEVIDAGSMNDDLSNQKVVEDSSKLSFSDDFVTETLDAGKFQDTNYR